MARVLILFPHKTEEQKLVKKSIISSLHDEQNHLQLYTKRLNQLGYEFGDFPLNSFFWEHALKIAKPVEYFSMMGMTFEAANLDFAQYFSKVFKNYHDFETAEILDQVFEDEISHVKIGLNYLNRWRHDRDLWDYYCENLIYPLTPARSRGIHFSPEIRESMGFEENFVKKLLDYDDSFPITKRKH